VKCPGCGYQSYDLLETCKRCGAPMLAGGAGWVPPVSTTPAPEVLHVDEHDLERALLAAEMSQAVDRSFRVDDDLHLSTDGSTQEPEQSPDDPLPADPGSPGPSEPTFVLAGDSGPAGARSEPIIDRYDEVPERCWAPEVAGLGRRALAILVDQSILAGILGGFFLGASFALRLNDVDAGMLRSADGLWVSALPFALLAALVSFAYHSFFHISTGQTPGKALLGIAVRTSDGCKLSWGRAAARWFAALLGLICGGIGLLWAVFDSRRRGWADLISATVVALPPRESAGDVPRR